jgi:hypothetical protein
MVAVLFSKIQCTIAAQHECYDQEGGNIVDLQILNPYRIVIQDYHRQRV